MGRERGSRTGRCQGCKHLERARIERLLAAGASIKGTARKFAIDHHALRRHWINHVSAEARAGYIAGAGATNENFRDCSRLTGELQHGPLLNIQNNLLISPDYTKAIARIVSAVAPYPEAREAVIAALRDLDAASASVPALADHRSEGAPIDG